MKEIETARLCIAPMTADELQGLAERYRETAPELADAYTEMLEACRRQPAHTLWHTAWRLRRKADAVTVGDAGFKGCGETVEIGYGILPQYEGNGYATEAVNALCAWAFTDGRVAAVEAETAPDNRASQRVLEKCGFAANGAIGAEGPRFVLNRR